jgi:PKD repeat protein
MGQRGDSVRKNHTLFNDFILIATILGLLYALSSCECNDFGDLGKQQGTPEAALSVEIISPSVNSTIIEGQPVNFEGSAEGGTEPFTYLWTFGGGAPESDLKNPKDIRFNARGTYTVTLMVRDGKDATGSDKITITVLSPETVSAGINHTLAIKPDGTL